MKSDKTFQEEFLFLLTHVPEALEFQDEDRSYDFLENHFNLNEENYIFDRDNLEITRLPDEFYDLFFRDENIQSFMEYSSSNDIGLLESAKGSNISIDLVQKYFINFGTESFGMYLPFHRFMKNKYNPWGIYLFPELIGPHIDELYKVFRSGISHHHLLEYYIWCVYRHELFHFQTESFATGFEVLLSKAFYLSYEDEVYSKFAYTKDWLEEALAEASVLESRLVRNKIGLNSKLLKAIYKYDLDRMPPGYKDYECKSYGGPKEAHKYLAAQIIHHNNKFNIPTSIRNIKQEFLQSDKKVPVYMVTGLRFINRIQ